jgi:hypothetical protein
MRDRRDGATVKADSPSFKTEATAPSDRCGIKSLRFVLRDQHQ